MGEREEQFQWWGSALFWIARAVEFQRIEDDVRRREFNKEIDLAGIQARYLFDLCGAWPESIAMPGSPPLSYVRVPVCPKQSGRLFHPVDGVEKVRIVDVRLLSLHNSDGFWAATFADEQEPVMFWPTPCMPPKWWHAR